MFGEINNMVIRWIIASLDRFVAKIIKCSDDAQEIWNDLEEIRFGKSSFAQLYSSQEELANLNEVSLE